MTPIRWKHRSFRLVATTPQLGHPGGCFVSKMIWRLLSALTVAEMTVWSDRLKMLVAASPTAPVGSFKARGPVPG
jgi:hypothetical protein